MRQNYRPADDQVIIKHVKKNFQNISFALDEASKELGRTKASVQARYYGKLVSSENTMMLVSKSGQGIMNRKVIARRGEVQDPLMLEVVKEMAVHMSREQKKELIKILVNS